MGYLLQGHDDRVVEGVAGRLDCQELCLTETEFSCASAEYDYTKAECRLSKQTRRSQPASYRATTQDIDYIENQCVREEADFESCKYESYEDQDIGYSDIKLRAGSAEEVRPLLETWPLTLCCSAETSATRHRPSTAGASPSYRAAPPASSQARTQPLLEWEL